MILFMARPLRIELAGGVFHIYSRGDRREDIYMNDDDRRIWLGLLGKVCEKFNWICHAYCLMDNHYHLVIETLEETLSDGMRQLNGVYTQSVNSRHNLVGHLFQGRFKSILVEKESYLLELIRYVLLNPVRACKVTAVSEWPWSSYRIHIGTHKGPGWFDANWVLSHFNGNRTRARELFIEYVQDGIGLPSVWENLKDGGILGSDSYASEIGEKFGIRSEPDKSLNECKSNDRPLEKYEVGCGLNRKVSIVEAYSSGRYTMTEIADHFKVSISTVSRAVRDDKNR